MGYTKEKCKWVLRLRILIFVSIIAVYGLISTTSVTEQREWQPAQTFYLHPLSRKLLVSNPVLENEMMAEKSTFNHNREKFSTDYDVVPETDFVILNSSLEPELLRDNCTPAAIFDFPSDGLTKAERQKGFVAFHCLIACYCFWLIAIVCDDYFVPAVDSLCEKMQMKKDIAGATFMAIASSSSELFINCVATFITEGDIGVGTIVGSAVFNILAVPACCGLFAGQVVHLDWWPVSRDCLMYGLAVILLIFTLLDGKIMWYESLFLVLAYVMYIIAISCNDYIARRMQKFVNRYTKTADSSTDDDERTPLIYGTVQSKECTGLDDSRLLQNPSTETESISEEFALNPWEYDKTTCLLMQILKWPIVFALWSTIPDCRRKPHLRYWTFLVCVLWIGVMSYVIIFMITVIGDTLNIPDSVMGLTFLAAGTSVPEAVSSVIVTNQGHGTMGISNSIGSNTFDILLCLGLPWLIKSLFFPTSPGYHEISLKSSGMAYSAGSLLSTLFGLYCAFLLNKFKLDWKVGVVCSTMYVLFLVFASMIELNYFFPVNLPACSHD